MTNPAAIVAADTGDDAGVWRLEPDRALVATVDYLTPVVDDARLWGRIAATNAASDVYAMGARPLFALNIVGWPVDQLPTSLLSEVLAGGADAAAAGGWVVIGGHSIDDPEPKYGAAVVGEAHPDRLLRTDRLRDGDELILTKPLGTGVIATAVKQGVAPPAVVDAAVDEMVRLNDVAARTALDAGARGATDVTGFGLLGHLLGMLRSSGLDAEIAVADVPLLPGAGDLADAGSVPGGTVRNRDHVLPALDAGGHDDVTVTLLADAQTSGGLLFGVAPGRVDRALAQLAAHGHRAARVGRTSGGTGRIRLR